MQRVAVAILDRDNWSANTDIIVVVDPRPRSMTWVPRDLWSPLIADRINAAFARGGCPLLLEALADSGFPCEAALCIRRSAVERALADVSVTVPVHKPLAFWYPLQPTRPIEEGRKQVAFEPPAEQLSGERIHQWMGARTPVAGRSDDLDRNERQQVLLRALLTAGAAFTSVLSDPDCIRTAGDPLETLSAVDARWTMETFAAVSSARIDGKAVLVQTPGHVRSARSAEAG